MTRSHYGHDDSERYHRCADVGVMQEYLSRNLPVREAEPETGNGQPRRRIAVACGRCRKRKIRCSGDPGNGKGCTNCRSAGADSTCQFNRVGSVDCSTPLYGQPHVSSHYSGFASSPSLSMGPIAPANASNYLAYSRTYPSGQCPPTLTTRNACPQTWSSFSYGDDSPVEGYNVHSSDCLQNHETLTSLFGSQDGLRWSASGHKQHLTGNQIYIDQERSPSYIGGVPPYLSTSVARQPTMTTETFSPFGMTSLHSSLPGPVDRQLPMPTSNRAQGLSSYADQLSMRPLMTSQGPHVTNLNTTASYTKAAMAWNTDSSSSDSRQSSINSQASDETISSQSRDTASTSSIPETGVLGYIPVTSDSPDQSPTSVMPVTYSTTAQPTSLPSINGRYSNSVMVITGAPSSGSMLSRQGSSSNLYSFSADSSSKPISLSEMSGSESTLVNGQRYMPLYHSQAHHTTSSEALRRDSFENRIAPAHTASITSLNRSY